jgi:DNA repair ATPase RecN
MAIPLQEIDSSNSACDHSSSSSSSSSVGNSASLYALQGPGLDAATFLLAAGPGEPLRPLATVASGGEAARLLLALKAAPAEAAAMAAAAEAALEAAVPLQGERGGAHATAGTLGAPILVMDELDAGVGSRLGEPVGRLLRCMVASRAASQLIVVTHVPHVAAAASQHVRVAKADAGGGRVVSAFTTLCTPEERTAELADMLGLPGAEGRAMAAELLAAASAPL